MTNTKTTKRALLTSVMALVLCFAMLLGTTFAWFTDSVTSGSNVIKTGNLDIEVEYTLDGTTWNDLDGADDLFQKGLWEPGHTEIVALKITNKGSLALKYTAKMNVTEETIGKTKDGDDIVLSELLKVNTITMDAGPIGDALVGHYFSGENALTGNECYFNELNVLTTEEFLEAGASKYSIIKVDMPTSVGNEANHDGVNVPSIEFGINVLATQVTHENDSFGNQYDADATYPEIESGWDGTYPAEMPATFVVDSANDTIRIQDEYAFAYLKNWLADDSSYNQYDVPVCKNIVFEADLDMGNKNWEPIALKNFIMIDGQNHTIKNLKVEGINGVGLFASVGNGKSGETSVKNFVINGADVKGNNQVAAFIGQNDSATIDNVHVLNATVSGTANVGGIEGRSYKSASNSSVVNSTITGGKRVGGISGFSNSNNQDSPVYANNLVDNVTISGERVGGFIGQSAAGKGGITVKDSTVKNCVITATIDAKYYPANDFIGNNTSSNGAATVLENNTAENNTLN